MSLSTGTILGRVRLLPNQNVTSSAGASILSPEGLAHSLPGAVRPRFRLNLKLKGLEGRHINLDMAEWMCQPFRLLSSFLELNPVVSTTGIGFVSLSGFEHVSFHLEQNSHQNRTAELQFVAQSGRSQFFRGYPGFGLGTRCWQVLSIVLAIFLSCLIPSAVFAQETYLRNDTKWYLGCELFQMLLEERGLTQMQSLEASLETPKTSVIVLAGDMQRLRVDVWIRIAQFAKRGGNVLIASDQGRVMTGIGEVRPGPVVSLDQEDQYLDYKDCIRIKEIDTSHPTMLGVNEIVSNRTAWLVLLTNSNSSSLFRWKTIASMPEKCKPSASSGQPVISIGSTNVENSGVIAIVADTSILSNGMLWHGDNATFAIRVSELLAEGKRSSLSFIVDGRVMGNYKERLQTAEPKTASGDREERNTPTMQQIPETDLETKLRMANNVLKSVADSNILNEALANQPRPMNARLYTFVVLGILASLGALWCLVYLLRRVPSFLARQPVVPHVSAFQMDAGAMNRSSQFGPAAFILAREFCKECSGSSGDRDWKNKATGFQFSYAVPNDKAFREKLEYVRSFEISNLVPRVSEKEFLKLGKTIQELREALRPPKIDGVR